MTTTTNPMLTAVLIPCVRCGATAETVHADRRLLGNKDRTCCGPASQGETVCWFCGDITAQPYRLGRHLFCCRPCAAEYAQ